MPYGIRETVGFHEWADGDSWAGNGSGVAALVVVAVYQWDCCLGSDRSLCQ